MYISASSARGPGSRSTWGTRQSRGSQVPKLHIPCGLFSHVYFRSRDLDVIRCLNLETFRNCHNHPQEARKLLLSFQVVCLPDPTRQSNRESIFTFGLHAW